MFITKGQQYRINSTQVGFTNFSPIDILLVIKHIDYETDLLDVSPLPLPGSFPDDNFLNIVNWFKKEYPRESKESSILKNIKDFEKLIATGRAVLYKDTQ